MSSGTACTYERASIVLVQLDPVRGSEQGKIRPCVIVSDAATVRRSRAKLLYSIVPLTCSTTLVGPLAPRIKARKGGSTADGVALCMHVRTVDPVRIVGFVGTLSADEMRLLQTGLGVLFGLEAAP